MKTNKEFIEGIYKKADEISNDKKREKKNNIRKICNIAAIVVITFAIGMNIDISTNQEKNPAKENFQNEEKTISLKTVENFENFCAIVKNSNGEVNKIVTNGAYSDSITESLTSATNTYDSSTTNNQVENVDEADIVKVEQGYIYYIAGKKIVIIDAKSGAESAKISEIDYSEEKYSPQEIYVNKNKLIVIGREYGTSIVTCGVAYNDVIISESKTYIIIYDISDKKEPKEIRKVEVDGNYISSRMIQDNIYFAISKNIYSSEILNKEIEELNEMSYKPKYKDSAVSEEENCIEYDNIYCFQDIETTNYLILGGINLENNEAVDMQTFLGAGNYIYSSEKNMYIAKSKTEYGEDYEYISSSTHVLKFSLDNGKVQFKAEANIDGHINNQFSMDESGEYFRIATTTGRSWSTEENTSNNLYVLNNDLELIGEVADFAQGERIYSVRYVQSKAYVVTFKQTDPLFVIDLSEPTNPQILGKLKIPGYSTYLHPYDETHIIGFGYDTKDDGTRITTNGLKMVMFDVSDLANPKELFKVAVGDKNTSSELAYNHKALLYSKEKNIMAFPLNTYSRTERITRAVIYEVDLENGFILKGEIANKYTDSSQIVQRIVFVNNTYYTLSKALIKVANMDTLQVIKEIEI